VNKTIQAAVMWIATTIAFMPVSPSATPVYPLKQSTNRRYLVDQANMPVLLVGDSPQALMVNVTTNEAAMFFADRSALGFNTVWVNLLCSTYTGGRADAATRDGIRPFTTNLPTAVTHDLTKPNEAYFARADDMIRLAAQQGIQMLLDPCETGSFLSVMLANGTNRCRAYGQFLGRRYRDVPNLIWMSGNDFQDWRTPASDAVVRAVALGILDEDTNHLHTAELDYVVSSSLDDTNWNSILGLNAAYTYRPTYARLLQDYQRPNFLPTFLVEANYEFESLQGPVTTPPILRKQEYWTMTSGACGQLYGNRYTWPFVAGWQDNLDTPGAMQMSYMKQFFAARAWYDLVPDIAHTVVTSNYGVFSSTSYVADNDYLTAARTSDGSLIVIYTPILRQFTVDLAQLRDPAIARWFDPSAGAFQAIPGSPLANSGSREFAPPGANADGDGGWVLVLETNPPPDPPPPPPVPPMPKFVQQNYATPQTPQAQVAVPYRSAQLAGNANLLAIGWNDTTASLTAVVDSAGNGYQAVVPTFRGTGLSQAIYAATAIKPGSNTVTVTFDQPAVYVDLRITEYSGLERTNAFDAGASASGVSASANSGPITTSATNQLLFGAGITATTFSAAGSGFTQRVITVPDADLIEDKVSTVAGIYSASAPLSSGAWLMQIAAFRPQPPAPRLGISVTPTNAVMVSWPAAATEYALESRAELGPTNWALVTNGVSGVDGDDRWLLLPMTTRQYYRLRRP
jgi:hypothetical protein